MADDTINITNTEGARLDPVYHKKEQPIVGVPVTDIQDASSSAKEELFLFSGGSFLFSGAFWLGVERYVTQGEKDALFLACIAFCICGAVLWAIGIRQSSRRVTRLERYLPDSKSK